MSKATNNHAIQSLDRGLRILEFVSERDGPVRLGELADLLGVEKSSAHRLARTLVGRGYLKQNSDTLGYVMSGKVFSLAARLASGGNLRLHARKHLRFLARKTGETAHLAVRGEDGVLLIDHEFGRHAVAVTTQWGNSEPYHCTALGKALLSGLDRAGIRSMIGTGRLPRYTENTITRMDDLIRECEEVIESLIAFDRDEFNPGLNCIASPIFDFRGVVTAAIGISGPKERLKEAELKEFGHMVRNCARDLSEELGYSVPNEAGLKTGRDVSKTTTTSSIRR